MLPDEQKFYTSLSIPGSGMDGSIWAIQDALLAASVNVEAQASAPVNLTTEKSVAHASKVDIAILVRPMHLSYSILRTFAEVAPLRSLLIAELS